MPRKPELERTMDIESATNASANAGDASESAAEAPGAPGEAPLRTRLRRAVNEEPWLAVCAGAAVGGALGGLFLQGAARFVFIAAAGYLAHGLWQREGSLDIDDVIARLEGRRVSPRTIPR